jgi:hypothetical protein
MMEAVRSSETSVSICQTTRSCIPGDSLRQLAITHHGQLESIYSAEKKDSVQISSFCKKYLSLHYTERCGRVANTPTSYSQEPGFDSRPRRQPIMIEVFRGFAQSLQGSAERVP